MNKSRPQTLGVFCEVKKEVDTSDLWGEEFEDIIPTLSPEESASVARALDDSDEDSFRVATDD